MKATHTHTKTNRYTFYLSVNVWKSYLWCIQHTNWIDDMFNVQRFVEMFFFSIWDKIEIGMNSLYLSFFSAFIGLPEGFLAGKWIFKRCSHELPICATHFNVSEKTNVRQGIKFGNSDKERTTVVKESDENGRKGRFVTSTKERNRNKDGGGQKKREIRARKRVQER